MTRRLRVIYARREEEVKPQVTVPPQEAAWGSYYRWYLFCFNSGIAALLGSGLIDILSRRSPSPSSLGWKILILSTAFFTILLPIRQRASAFEATLSPGSGSWFPSARACYLALCLLFSAALWRLSWQMHGEGPIPILYFCYLFLGPLVFTVSSLRSLQRPTSFLP